jgi:phosphatidylglycerophosphate synthase
MKKISIREIRKKYQYSESDTYYAKLICRKLSPFFTWFFLQTSIKPNTITLFMIFSGILGGIFLCQQAFSNNILVVLFLQLFLILDCVDGEVARAKEIFSKKGKFLDLVANDIVFVMIFYGLVIKLKTSSYQVFNLIYINRPLIIIFGFNCIIFYFLYHLEGYYAKEIGELGGSFLKTKIGRKKMSSKIFKLVSAFALLPNIILLVSIAVLLNYAPYILFFYGIFFPLYWIASLVVKILNKEVR